MSRWGRAGEEFRPSIAVVVLILGSLIPHASRAEAPYTEGGSQPFLTYSLQSPGVCASCHAGYDDSNHIEPWDTWAGSMMANAARDPIFWAALDVANADGEEMGFAGVGEFCLRCHVPMGWTKGRASADLSSSPPNPPSIGDADGCLLGPSTLGIDDPDSDFSGLTCHFCHRMEIQESPPQGEPSYYLESGKYWIDDDPCPTPIPPGFEPCRHGPYDYDYINDQPPPHPWAQASYLTDNLICGNCHNVTNPLLNLVDEAGVDQGVGFPIERTFMEWQESEFADPQSLDAANCSSCHMPDATHSPVYASEQQLYNRSGDLPIHQFAGGNTWVPQILKGEYPNLDRGDSFDATTIWALDMLENRSATIDLASPDSVLGGSDLPIQITVTNLTGHKLPTGYGEGRRMWLHVIARDGLETTVWESGAWNPATGDLAQDPQLKVYEVQQGIWNENGDGNCDVLDSEGGHLFHFVRNNCIALDNRIPPLGFTGGDNVETQPVNYSYPEAAPGVLVNFDTTDYLIPIPVDVPGPISIEAHLYYQTSSKEYIEFLRDQAVERGFPDDCTNRSEPLPLGMSRGEYLYALWSDPAYGKSPPVGMASTLESADIVLFADGFESGDSSAWSSIAP